MLSVLLLSDALGPLLCLVAAVAETKAAEMRVPNGCAADLRRILGVLLCRGGPPGDITVLRASLLQVSFLKPRIRSPGLELTRNDVQLEDV